MDIISHAVAGAATGALFGRPIAGAVIAALPDAVLSIKRRMTPSEPYNLTHSLLFVVVAATVAQLVGAGALVAACLISHLVLDLPTHGKTWAPPLLYPFLEYRFSFGDEWEWFNPSWFRGLLLTFIWSIVCVLLYATGFRL